MSGFYDPVMAEVVLQAPTECAAGHPLGPGNVLVSYRTCARDGGHTAWRCPRCGWIGYDTPCTNPAQLDGHEYGR